MKGPNHIDRLRGAHIAASYHVLLDFLSALALHSAESDNNMREEIIFDAASLFQSGKESQIANLIIKVTKFFAENAKWPNIEESALQEIEKNYIYLF